MASDGWITLGGLLTRFPHEDYFDANRARGASEQAETSTAENGVGTPITQGCGAEPARQLFAVLALRGSRAQLIQLSRERPHGRQCTAQDRVHEVVVKEEHSPAAALGLLHARHARTTPNESISRKPFRSPVVGQGVAHPSAQ